VGHGGGEPLAVEEGGKVSAAPASLRITLLATLTCKAGRGRANSTACARVHLRPGAQAAGCLRGVGLPLCLWHVTSAHEVLASIARTSAAIWQASPLLPSLMALEFTAYTCLPREEESPSAYITHYIASAPAVLEGQRNGERNSKTVVVWTTHPRP
jgi:hypothetical protein